MNLDELREALDVPSALQRIEVLVARATTTLHRIELAARRIERKLGEAMVTLADFNASLDNIDASIADINVDNADAVALIAQLRDQIAAGGLTADEEAGLLARITAAEAAIAAAEAGTDAITPDAPEEPPA